MLSSSQSAVLMYDWKIAEALAKSNSIIIYLKWS